jgi:poly-gamma-glutamate synthesis protein (capsule biosynthesis protein)
MTLRSIVFAVLCAAGAAVFLFGLFSGRHFTVENTAGSPFASVMIQAPHETRMVLVGDIMLSRLIGKLMAGTEDYGFIYASTTDAIRAADIAFANLESPLSLRGTASGNKYSFRADPRTVEGLAAAGFDAVSVANNHIWDYGEDAFSDTLSILKKSGITPVGGGDTYDEAHAPRIITRGETRVAFLAYTNLLPPRLGEKEAAPAVARYTDDILKADIVRAKELADVVVVSFHWGDEYQTKHSAEQKRVAHLAIDAGATIVVGHHPHVVQEVEEYGGGYIAYSVGNFVFDQNFSKDTKRGLALLVTIKDGALAAVTTRTVAFTDDYQPYFSE